KDNTSSYTEVFLSKLLFLIPNYFYCNMKACYNFAKGGQNMLATIQSAEKGYLAQFDRLINHPIEEVWAVLTENEKLKIWMSHLEIVDLKIDGLIKFHQNDG